MRYKLFIIPLVALLAVSGCGKPASVAGEWTVHHGKAVDMLTLQEKDGVLNGQIKLDPDFVGGTWDVRGIRAGTNVEWSYESYFASTTTENSGNVVYTMKGTVAGDAMGGSFSVLGPFSSRVSNPNETALWVAHRKD